MCGSPTQGPVNARQALYKLYKLKPLEDCPTYSIAMLLLGETEPITQAMDSYIPSPFCTFCTFFLRQGLN